MNLTAKDGNDHTLVSLWKAYYSASEADRPKDELAALDKIKAEALAKHLAWDYYDACDKYVQTRSRINWKDRNEAEAERSKEMETKAEPVARFFYSQGRGMANVWDYVHSHKAALQKSFNPEFYSRDSNIESLAYGPALAKILTNDYEYTVWSLWHRGNLNAKDELKTLCSGKYPFDAFWEYSYLPVEKTKNDEARLEALKAYAAKHDGKAVALLARQDLISREFSRLAEVNGSSRDYIRLADLCRAFKADQARFGGTEKQIADCCDGPASLLDRLEGKSVDAEIKDDILTILTRNVSEVDVVVTNDKEKKVFSDKVTNPTPSFYVQDSLAVRIPVLNDGLYFINCSSGKDACVLQYRRHTLSIAARRDSKGLGVYVADYKSGEPVGKCTLEMVDITGTETLSRAEITLDGFTHIPAAMEDIIKTRKGVCLRASLTRNGVKRASEDLNVDKSYLRTASVPENYPHHESLLLTDRSAFNPGETVHYKVILYQGSYEYSLRQPGIVLKARLVDAEDNELATQNLVTGEFGSAAGSFVIPKCERYGIFHIYIEEGGKELDTKAIRVDEFVLPTFNLSWDANNRLYYAGDRVRFSGKVSSYSGHKLSNARATYKIYGLESELSGVLELGPDGSFAVEFDTPEDEWSNPSITINITDATGETLEFSKSVSVSRWMYVSAELTNQSEGSFRREGYRSGALLGEDVAKVEFCVGGKLPHPGLKISWKLLAGKTVVTSGTAANGETVSMDLSGRPSGIYTVEAHAELVTDKGNVFDDDESFDIVKVSDTDRSLNFDVQAFFKELPGDEVALQVGNVGAPMWVVAEVFGEGSVLYARKLLKLSGKKGTEGSLQTIRFERGADWTENVTLNVLTFLDGNCHRYACGFFKPRKPVELPLSFTRFLDTTAPGKEYSFSIKTEPGVECAATVFDVSTETISTNRWFTRIPNPRPSIDVNYNVATGGIRSWGGYSNKVMVRGTKAEMASRASGAVMAQNSATLSDNLALEVMDYAEEEAIPFALAEKPSETAPTVRENFANTVAWEPFLHSDKDGNIEFKFANSDKLSTYAVQLFAHDKNFNNNVLRREMTVTLPVKIAVVQPQYLYVGDRYVARVSLASSVDRDVPGVVAVRFLDGGDYKTAAELAVLESRITVPARSGASWSCDIEAPEGVPTLGLLVSFTADEEASGSDAVFVSLPVWKPVQTITEAHSALFRPSDDRNALERKLLSQFVNAKDAPADISVISIRQMLAEALPSEVEPKADNCVALSQAYYANVLVRGLGQKGSGRMDEIKEKLLACINADGGIAWFEGMSSSPILTAVLLERAKAVSDASALRGGTDELLPAEAVAKAVAYLDRNQFGANDRPYWCGGVSLEHYLHVRSLYAGVPLAQSLKAADKKAVRQYLTPDKARGLNGCLLAKARRIKTLRALLASSDGLALAGKLGVRSTPKLSRSLQADLESLRQYAVAHASGGTYFPNAVMPWRGLLESELYAHALLCELFDGEDIAEGVRLWIMVQKETQQWDTDPAYIEALGCVYRGTEETLSTSVLVARKSVELPFADIQPAGNGLRLESAWYLVSDSTAPSAAARALKPGDVLHVGDKIEVRYSLWSEENRSFVRLTAPRSAALRPVQQLSGHYGWRPVFRGPDTSGLFFTGFSAGAYRTVLADRSEYWFEVFPEEDSTIVEDYFVTQEGRFVAPAPVVESLYAPHYRANGGAPEPVVAQ